MGTKTENNWPTMATGPDGSSHVDIVAEKDQISEETIIFNSTVALITRGPTFLDCKLEIRQHEHHFDLFHVVLIGTSMFYFLVTMSVSFDGKDPLIFLVLLCTCGLLRSARIWLREGEIRCEKLHMSTTEDVITTSTITAAGKEILANRIPLVCIFFFFFFLFLSSKK
jgi:hypothetical protein